MPMYPRYGVSPEPHLAHLDDVIETGDPVAVAAALDHPEMNEAVIRDRLFRAVDVGPLALVQCLLDRIKRRAKPCSGLNMAAILGDPAMLDVLLPYCSPRGYESHALRLAAEHGNLAAVEKLIPLSNPKARQSDALRWAASKGYLEVVKALAPVSDVSAQNDGALRNAARHGHHAVAAFLWPLSKVATTVEHLITNRQWAELETLTRVAPVAVWVPWLARIPDHALPQARQRLQAMIRQEEAHRVAPSGQRPERRRS